MNDSEYFQSYLTAAKFIFDNDTEMCFYLKDAQFNFQFVSTQMLDLLGFSNANQLKGCNNQVLTQARIVDAKFIERMDRQDQNVSKNKKSGCYLELVPDGNNFRLIVLRKQAIVNPETGNCVGIQGQITDLIWPHVLKTLFKLHETKGLLVNHKNISDPIKDYPINNTQHMVLYLCINNYSYSEIALFMNAFGYKITPIRVNDYLEQLKLIFHVRTKTQLIEKAIGLNFHALLPCDLFNNINSFDIQHEVAQVICCNCKTNNCHLHT